VFFIPSGTINHSLKTHIHVYLIDDCREEVKPKRSLEAKIIWSRLHYFSHVMRAKGSLERDIMLGQVAGHRRQGKPQLWWLDSIKGATGLCLEALTETVQDRKNGACWWKKSLRIGNTQMWNEHRRRQWQTTPEQHTLPRKSFTGSPGV
jgi:hypothetical protein